VSVTAIFGTSRKTIRIVDKVGSTAHLVMGRSAESRGDKMTPTANFAAVTAAAMFGHQRSG
jgi:hypothetical protein